MSSREENQARRDKILDAVAKVLRDEKRSANEMQLVVEACGIPFQTVAAEFKDTDEIMLAVGERITKRVIATLQGERSNTDETRQRLLDFAETLHAAYGSELVGLYRVFMTESSRRKDLRNRFYDHGPHAIGSALARFLAEAKDKRLVEIDDCDCAAEHLMGLLREPLYRELALHSTGIGATKMCPASSVEVFWNGCAIEREMHEPAG